MLAVQHRHYGSHIAFQFVGDGERESISERVTQAAVGLGVNAGIQSQCVNVLENMAFRQIGFRLATPG